ncbi:hypothetical protein, partial [Fictibacillus sp. 23RED33]|uniref:hypothetical protein n=1 Tax=Fictibacillus sp. 23RED33 TaxID=2745879 RepID=UPI001E4D572C
MNRVNLSKRNFLNVNGLIFATVIIFLLNLLYIFEIANYIRFPLIALLILFASVLYTALEKISGSYG